MSGDAAASKTPSRAPAREAAKSVPKSRDTAGLSACATARFNQVLTAFPVSW